MGENSVDIQLKNFTEYFVAGFENKLELYLSVLEGKSSEESRFGSELAAIADAFTGSPGPLVGEIAKRLPEWFKNNNIRKLADRMSKLVYGFREPAKRHEIRAVLVHAAFDIFQSFEMQFMSVEAPTGGETRAMQKLATTAVASVFEYFNNEEVPCDLTVEVILRSLLYSSKNAASPWNKMRPDMLKQGGTVQYDKDNKLNTVKLFKKAGIVVEKVDKYEYYETESSHTKIYGYRRFFIATELSRKESLLSECTLEENKHKKYRYVLTPDMLQAKTRELLRHVENRDSGHMEQRMRESMQSLLQETVQDLFNNVLKESLLEFIDIQKAILRKLEEKREDKQPAAQPSKYNMTFSNNKVGNWNMHTH